VALPKVQQQSPDEGTVAILEVDGLAEELHAQSYAVSNDVLQVGDAMAAAVPMSRKQWQKVQSVLEHGPYYSFYLKNPAINEGKRVLRQRGVLRGLGGSSSIGSPNIVNLQGQDLGWHLINQSAPEFYRLDHGTLDKLLKKLILDNPDWGFKDIRPDNEVNRSLQNGRAAAQLALAPHVFLPYKVIQINPGQRVIDVLNEYVQREGLLLNVSGDGCLQLFNPRYDQAPSYVLHHHDADEPEVVLNNVWDVSFNSQIEGIYTRVTCVWDEICTGVLNVPYTPNLGRHRASYYRRKTVEPAATDGIFAGPPAGAAADLPFNHVLVFADGEPLSRQQGLNRATWKAHRAEWDCFVWRGVTRGHAQAGTWWAPDTMVTLDDSYWGYQGTYYCSAVTIEGRMGGANLTRVELRKPGLLGNQLLRVGSSRKRADGAQESGAAP